MFLICKILLILYKSDRNQGGGDLFNSVVNNIINKI